MVKTFRGQMTVLALSLGLAVLVIAYAGWWLSGYTAMGLLAGGAAGIIIVAAMFYILFTPIHVNLLQVLGNTQKAINGDLTGHIEKKNYGWGELNAREGLLALFPKPSIKVLSPATVIR